MHPHKQVSHMALKFNFLSDLKWVTLVKRESHSVIPSWVDRHISWFKLQAQDFIKFSLVILI
jgi:hypothetical protein